MTPADALPPLPAALQSQIDRIAAELLPLMRYPMPALRVVALVRVALLAEDALSQTLRQIRADRMAAVDATEQPEITHG
jgi:hypothetical protein